MDDKWGLILVMEKWKKENVLFNDAFDTFYFIVMASDICLKTTEIMREETSWGTLFRLAAKHLLYEPHTSCGALDGMKNNSTGPPGGIDSIPHCTMSGHYIKKNVYKNLSMIWTTSINSCGTRKNNGYTTHYCISVWHKSV